MRSSTTCQVCGRFLSGGARHDLATSCRPPVEPQRELRLHAMRSPFQAWPEQHLHHTARGRTVTSPLPGLGARLVERLARHVSAVVPPEERRRRFGPAAALRQLLQDGEEAALQAVLHPAPLLVSCDDQWHSVGLQDGQLLLHAHAGLDVAAELVAFALAGQLPQGCLRIAQLWEEREGASVSQWLGALPVFDAARAWLETGACLEERDPWVGQAWRPVALQRAAAVGVSELEMLQWLAVSRLPDVVRAWRDAGWTVREALELQPLLTPQQSVAWRAAGLDVNRIREAHRTRLDLQQAKAWRDAGWPLLIAGSLVARGSRLEDAQELLSEVGSRGRVVALAQAGVLDLTGLAAAPPQLRGGLGHRTGR